MSDHQAIPDNARCPECGAEATDDSIRSRRLSDVGYLHEDVNFVCSQCDNRWTAGIPRGSTDENTWVCDACGGDFMPHFVYVYPTRDEVRVRPKCKDCNWVPDDPLVLDCSTNGDNARFFVGHHTVTGDRAEATRNPID